MNNPRLLAGVYNMLINCANALPGQRLLIAYEPERFGHFDGDVVEYLAQGAAQMGLNVECIDVGFDAETPSLSSHLLNSMKGADIVVFLARLGDQLRFSEMPHGTMIINSYTLNTHLFKSAFATADYTAFEAVKSAIDCCVAAAEQITMTCNSGTHVTGNPNLKGVAAKDTTLKRFPLSMFSPVPAADFSGKIALGGFLTGTGSRYFDEQTIEFDAQVYALLSDGRLAGFEGEPADVAKADAHYDRVADIFDIDRNFVHSWHAGIHPGCGYPWDIRKSYDRWAGAAFGNPRILHFHTCGAYAPGEISWNVFDPIVEIDGVLLWENGRLMLERLPEGAEILTRHPSVAKLFANPDMNIGLRERT